MMVGGGDDHPDPVALLWQQDLRGAFYKTKKGSQDYNSLPKTASSKHRVAHHRVHLNVYEGDPATPGSIGKRKARHRKPTVDGTACDIDVVPSPGEPMTSSRRGGRSGLREVPANIPSQYRTSTPHKTGWRAEEHTPRQSRRGVPSPRISSTGRRARAEVPPSVDVLAEMQRLRARERQQLQQMAALRHALHSMSACQPQAMPSDPSWGPLPSAAPYEPLAPTSEDAVFADQLSASTGPSGPISAPRAPRLEKDRRRQELLDISQQIGELISYTGRRTGRPLTPPSRRTTPRRRTETHSSDAHARRGDPRTPGRFPQTPTVRHPRLKGREGYEHPFPHRGYELAQHPPYAHRDDDGAVHPRPHHSAPGPTHTPRSRMRPQHNDWRDHEGCYDFPDDVREGPLAMERRDTAGGYALNVRHAQRTPYSTRGVHHGVPADAQGWHGSEGPHDQQRYASVSHPPQAFRPQDHTGHPRSAPCAPSEPCPRPGGRDGGDTLWGEASGDYDGEKRRRRRPPPPPEAVYQRPPTECVPLCNRGPLEQQQPAVRQGHGPEGDWQDPERDRPSLHREGCPQAPPPRSVSSSVPSSPEWLRNGSVRPPPKPTPSCTPAPGAASEPQPRPPQPYETRRPAQDTPEIHGQPLPPPPWETLDAASPSQQHQRAACDVDLRERISALHGMLQGHHEVPATPLAGGRRAGSTEVALNREILELRRALASQEAQNHTHEQQQQQQQQQARGAPAPAAWVDERYSAPPTLAVPVQDPSSLPSSADAHGARYPRQC
eukprot:TRINITY_DN4334_c0_g1_i1.p1 TRINITY_DN4334_c0_g1~~TRINITY_DN4334_c0_g1_i1.p1  ORF type:complete len:777 (+),score=63.02 TRINITY_DN4334_c0_g1_i1:48-2378(+)